MSEEIFITSHDKGSRYAELLPQIVSVTEVEPNLIANLANVSSMLKEVFDFFWVGFYLVHRDELVLGPFQGTLACTRIKFDRGVCGKSWSAGETVIVTDVDNFDGHIACSSLSKSEIVVPIKVDGTVVAVLDVDSDTLASFDSIDELWLGRIAEIIGNLFERCEKF